jgi:diguanylate cyclase (GGDEF)-like protein
LISLALFPVFPGGAGFIQYVYPQLPVACFTLSFATLLLYQNWLDDLISADPLTRLNNRKQLRFTYEQWVRHSDQVPLYMLLIDANKFKAINDIYGHIQGDAALERIAETLRLACKELHCRHSIARYGGDEFVILATPEEEAVMEQLRSHINLLLEKLNKAAAAPYELSVSAGIAKANPELSLKDLITRADENLYKEKSKRRAANI